MKRSKIFLFLTTGCLAVAGIFAAKANHFAKTVGYYVTAGKHCAEISSCVKGSGQITCLTPAGNKIFTQRTAADACSTPLHYTEL